MKQHTISKEVSVKGKALHTGDAVNLTFKPAEENHGIIFKRVDLYGKPEIKPDISLVGDLVRNTTIASKDVEIHTVEHVLSALSGLGIDNVLIEMDASEPPIMDGSARPYTNALQEAGIQEQTAKREYFELDRPVSISDGNRSIIALPHDGLKITCTSTDSKGFHTQHLSLEINPETFISQVAASRTFVNYEDVEALIKAGKIQGGSLDSAILIKDDKILSKEPLRFKDEFVRHKILDIIGDIVLLGKPLKAHIIAVCTGHALNAKLTRKLRERLLESTEERKEKSEPKATETAEAETVYNISKILKLLPHRYPFLMIDKVVEIKSNDELIAIKNITINEPYFQGHYPGRPVMPGVLQIEAMAQAAGILLTHSGEDIGSRIPLFMSCDKVKFRKAVQPGDQLEIHMKIVKRKGTTLAMAEGECRIGKKVASSASLMFTITDAPEYI